MSKAFVKEPAAEEEDDDVAAPPLPAGTRNYMTPRGYTRLRDELAHLVKVERPEVVRVVSWAAANGDRSENGDYIYGKRRLREIDRRIRFLTKRLEVAEVVDPAARAATDQIFFGATVRYATADGSASTIAIVGIDEADAARGRVSWISPIARALAKAREGDAVALRTPAGVQMLDVLEVRYQALD
ncbi:MAG: transcription elongation factor GreB [Betaproteobacteria bacterium]